MDARVISAILNEKPPLYNECGSSDIIQEQYKKMIRRFYSNKVITHFMSISTNILLSEYHGKITGFAKIVLVIEL